MVDRIEAQGTRRFTRRSAIAGVAAAPLTALPAHAAIETAEDPLVALWEKRQAAVKAMSAADDRHGELYKTHPRDSQVMQVADVEIDRLATEFIALDNEIATTPARTLSGLHVHAELLNDCCGGGDWLKPLAVTLMESIERLRKETGNG